MASINKVTWIGRLTGPKGEIAYRIITEVAPHFPAITFTIVGGPLSERFSIAAGDNVLLSDFIEDVNQQFQESDLVIGAGRVALEAMAFGLPVIAVGEACYIGAIDDETIDEAKATNFGDCADQQDWQALRLIDDITRLVSGEKLPLEKYTDYLADYRIYKVAPQVMHCYEQAMIRATLARFAEVPVLTYHRVLPVAPQGSKFNVYVTVDELERQLTQLKRRGFQFVTFKDIAQGLKPTKPIILTFDDGYEDNYLYLLPLLKKHNAKAVIFVLADDALTNNRWDIELGEPEAALMSSEQIDECHLSGHVEIASHGLSHRRLTTLTDDEINFEVSASKQRLEALINDEVVSFAYPYGDCDQRVSQAVAAAGYRFGVATISGPVKMADDLMRIRRITMFPKTDGFKFWKKTSGWYLRYCKIKGKDFVNVSGRS